MKRKIAICWFRQDLRLADNPALLAACEAESVLPIYILDTINPDRDLMGSASKMWLHYSLKSLSHSLDGKLWIEKGDPIQVITRLIDTYSIEAVYWGRWYEPWRIKRDE